MLITSILYNERIKVNMFIQILVMDTDATGGYCSKWDLLVPLLFTESYSKSLQLCIDYLYNKLRKT